MSSALWGLLHRSHKPAKARGRPSRAALSGPLVEPASQNDAAARFERRAEHRLFRYRLGAGVAEAQHVGLSRRRDVVARPQIAGGAYHAQEGVDPGPCVGLVKRPYIGLSYLRGVDATAC